MKTKTIPYLFAFILLLSNTIQSQPTLTKGMDAVVTFYGVADLMNPGTVANVKTVGDQFGAPHNVNWVPPIITPAITNWTADYLGQVFGIAIDDAGNVYFAATAMYWNWDRQRLADANPGIYGSGGNGYNPLGGAAGIYKADKVDLNNITVLTSAIPNTGYGLGNIAFAKVINKLYTSNLEDGKIYCLNPATGTTDFTYDPFTPDASGAQIAGYGERIFGLAVNYELLPTQSRLYYAVLINDHQSEIWSVKLNNDGSFDGSTNTLEIILPQSSPRTYISDIAFSSRGEMLVAEKGNPHLANVYQYFGKHNAWSLPMELFIASYNGGTGPGHNSAGGVDYGYSSKDTTNEQFYCDTIIWTQSNAIAGPSGPWLAYGLLSHPLNGYTNNSTYLNEAYIVNLRGSVTTYGLTPKGSFGDVECYDWVCPPTQTDICSKTNARIIKLQSATGECCYRVEISNTYRPDYFSGIVITSDNLSIANATKDITNTWSNITYQSPNQIVFTKRIFKDGIPLDTLGEYQRLGDICFTGIGPSHIKVDFIGNMPQKDTVCSKTLLIEGCLPPTPVDTSCVSVLDISSVCDSGAIIMKFRIKNNGNFTMRGLTLYSQNPDVNPSPKFIPIPDLLPNQTSGYFETTLIISNNADSACFFIAACDQNTTPGIAGPYPNWCCMDSIPYCVTIPNCDPCVGISFSAVQQDPVKCCYNLTLSSNYSNGNLGFLEFTGVGGTQFALLSGWSIYGSVSSSHVKIKAPGSGISPGSYPDFASFCLTGTSIAPHIILINSYDVKGTLVCTDTLSFDCELVTPTCANIINDSLYCSGDKVKYTFHVKNNAPFPIWQVDFRTSDIKLDIDHVQLSVPIAPGNTGGPFTVTIDSASKNLDRFCIYLTGHNDIYDSITGQAATECCTDSLGGICLPMIECGGCDTTICCQFENMIIPNGITPNEDGKNDVFEILNSTCCDYISIKVFNRWGNIEYLNEDYQNDWKGVNSSGKILVQGTYFILLELPDGNKKGIYVDIRY